MKQSKSPFGRRIQELLSERRMSQEEAAQVIGISRVTLSRLIHGSQAPTAETLGLIAERLRADMPELFQLAYGIDMPRPADELTERAVRLLMSIPGTHRAVLVELLESYVRQM